MPQSINFPELVEDGHLDLSHMDIQETKTLASFLETCELSILTVDLSFNRLNIDSVKPLIDVMTKKEKISVNLGINYFDIQTLYKYLMEKNLSLWLKPGHQRITMAIDDLYRSNALKALEELVKEYAAYSLEIQKKSDKFAEEKAAYYTERQKNSDKFAEENAAYYTERQDDMNKSINIMQNTSRNERESIEEVVSKSFEKYLNGHKYDDVCNQTILRIAYNNKQSLFEWDGVISCTKNSKQYLFMLETKSVINDNNVTSYINDVESRLIKTKDWINGNIKASNHINTNYEQWKKLKDFEIKIVFGSPLFMDAARKKVLDNGYYACIPSEIAQTVLEPLHA